MDCEKNTESSPEHEDMTALGENTDIIEDEITKEQTWESM